MKKVILICMAMAMMTVANAMVSYHQSDQLQTFSHETSVQPVFVMPVFITQPVMVNLINTNLSSSFVFVGAVFKHDYGSRYSPYSFNYANRKLQPGNRVTTRHVIRISQNYASNQNYTSNQRPTTRHVIS